MPVGGGHHSGKPRSAGKIRLASASARTANSLNRLKTTGFFAGFFSAPGTTRFGCPWPHRTTASAHRCPNHGGRILGFPLRARGTRPSKHFDRTGPRTDDKNVTEAEATHRPPPFRCWRPFDLQRPGQLCTRSLRVGVFVSRLRQDQCTNRSVFVF